MAGFAHICVVLVSGSRLLCLVVHISSKGTKAGNTEGQQGKQHFFGQIVYQKGRPERGMKLTVPTRLAINIVSSLTTTAETNSALPKRLPLPNDSIFEKQ